MSVTSNAKTILGQMRHDRCGAVGWRWERGETAGGRDAGLATGTLVGTLAAGVMFNSADCSRKALRISSQVWKRSLGSLARALRMMASMEPGRAGLMSDGATGSSSMIL